MSGYDNYRAAVEARQGLTVGFANGREALNRAGIRVLGQPQATGGKRQLTQDFSSSNTQNGLSTFSEHVDHTMAATLRVCADIIENGGTVHEVRFDMRYDGSRRMPDSRVVYSLATDTSPRQASVEVASGTDVRGNRNFEHLGKRNFESGALDEKRDSLVVVIPDSKERKGDRRINQCEEFMRERELNASRKDGTMMVRVYDNSLTEHALAYFVTRTIAKDMSLVDSLKEVESICRKTGGGGSGGQQGSSGGNEGGNDENQNKNGGGQKARDADCFVAAAKEGIRGSLQQEGPLPRCQFAAEGDIGGVGLRPALRPEVWTDPLQPGTESGQDIVFVIPDCAGDAEDIPSNLKGIIPKLSTDLVKQLTWEMYRGVYVAGKSPFVSLHFNRDGYLYPIMFPEYVDTAVGYFMTAADYYLKGMCHGGYIRLLGGDSVDTRNPHDLFAEVPDFRSLHEIMAEKGVSEDGQHAHGSFESAFRIVMDAHPETNALGITVTTNHRIERDIGASAEYMAELEKYQSENSGADTKDHSSMLDAFEEKRREIEERMHEHPLFSRLFQVLGLIQSLATVMVNLKAQGLRPEIPPEARQIRVAGVSGFPRQLPHLPLRKRQTSSLSIDWTDVVCELEGQSRSAYQSLGRTLASMVDKNVTNGLNRTQVESIYRDNVRALDEQLAGERSNQLRQIESVILQARRRVQSSYSHTFDERRARGDMVAELDRQLAQARESRVRVISERRDKLLRLVNLANQNERDLEAEFLPDFASAAIEVAARKGRRNKLSVLRQQTVAANEEILQSSMQVVGEAFAEGCGKSLKESFDRFSEDPSFDIVRAYRCIRERALGAMKNISRISVPKLTLSVVGNAFMSETVTERFDSASQTTVKLVGGCGFAYGQNHPVQVDESVLTGDLPELVGNALLHTSSLSLRRVSGSEKQVRAFRMKVERADLRNSIQDIADDTSMDEACGVSDDHRFAASGNVGALSRCRDFSRRTFSGATLLHTAAATGQREAVRFISQTANELVSVRSASDLTPLMTAIISGHYGCALDILGCRSPHQGMGAIHATTRDCFSALHYASSVGSVDVVKMLIDLGCANRSLSYLRATTKHSGKAAIHFATQRGHTNIVKLLVAADSSQVDLRLPNSETSLHLACREGHETLVHFLLSRGSSALLINNSGQDSISCAIRCQHLDIAAACLDSVNWESTSESYRRQLIKDALLAGVASGTSRLLDCILRICSVELDVCLSGMNWRFLHFIAAQGNLGAISSLPMETLHTMGLNHTDSAGNFPSGVARQMGNLAVSVYLNDLTGKTSSLSTPMPNQANFHPLVVASMRNNIDDIRRESNVFFLEHELRSLSSTGTSPLEDKILLRRFMDLFRDAAKQATTYGYSAALLVILDEVVSVGDELAEKVAFATAVAAAHVAATRNYFFILKSLIKQGYQNAAVSFDIAIVAAREGNKETLLWIIRRKDFWTQLSSHLKQQLTCEALKHTMDVDLAQVLLDMPGQSILDAPKWFAAAAHASTDMFAFVMHYVSERTDPGPCVDENSLLGAIQRGDHTLVRRIMSFGVNPNPEIEALLRQTQDTRCLEVIVDMTDDFPTIDESWAQSCYTNSTVNPVVGQLRRHLSSRDIDSVVRRVSRDMDLLSVHGGFLDAFSADCASNHMPLWCFLLPLAQSHSSVDKMLYDFIVAKKMAELPRVHLGSGTSRNMLEFAIEEEGEYPFVDRLLGDRSFALSMVAYRSPQNQRNILHSVSISGKIAAMAKLLEDDSLRQLVNKCDNENETSLSIAARIFAEDSSNGSRGEMIRLLLRNGADPNLSSPSAIVHLMRAGERATPLICELASGKSINQALVGGLNALACACHVGDDCVRVLLSTGADPLLPCPDGLLPLHHAIKERNDRAVHVLLQWGRAMEQLLSPVVDNTEILDSEEESMEDDSFGFNAIHMAIQIGSTSILRTLCYFISNQDYKGHEVVQNGKARMELANLSWLDYGRLSLQLGRMSMFEILTEQGLLDGTESSILSSAAISGRMDIVMFAEAKVDSTKGKTPHAHTDGRVLAHALSSGDPDVIEHFVVKDYAGRQAVAHLVPQTDETLWTFISKTSASPRALRALLSADVDPTLTNRLGKSCCEVAVCNKKCSAETLRFLLDLTKPCQASLNGLLRVSVSEKDFAKASVLLNWGSSVDWNGDSVPEKLVLISHAGSMFAHLIAAFSSDAVLQKLAANCDRLLLSQELGYMAPDFWTSYCEHQGHVCRALLLSPDTVVRRLLITTPLETVQVEAARALHYAARLPDAKYQSEVKKLVELAGRYMNFDIADESDGKALLHVFCARDNSRLVKMLLDKGACTLKTDSNGKVPLAIAIECRSSCAETIIDSVANKKPGVQFPVSAIERALPDVDVVCRHLSRPGTQRCSVEDMQKLMSFATTHGAAFCDCLKVMGWISNPVSMLHWCAADHSEEAFGVLTWVLQQYPGLDINGVVDGLTPVSNAFLHRNGRAADLLLQYEEVVPFEQLQAAVSYASSATHKRGYRILQEYLKRGFVPQKRLLAASVLSTIHVDTLRMLAKVHSKDMSDHLRAQANRISGDADRLSVLCPHVLSASEYTEILLRRRDRGLPVVLQCLHNLRDRGVSLGNENPEESLSSGLLAIARRRSFSEVAKIGPVVMNKHAEMPNLLWGLVESLSDGSLLSDYGVPFVWSSKVRSWWTSAADKASCKRGAKILSKCCHSNHLAHGQWGELISLPGVIVAFRQIALRTQESKSCARSLLLSSIGLPLLFDGRHPTFDGPIWSSSDGKKVAQEVYDQLIALMTPQRGIVLRNRMGHLHASNLVQAHKDKKGKNLSVAILRHYSQLFPRQGEQGTRRWKRLVRLIQIKADKAGVRRSVGEFLSEFRVDH